MSILGSIGNGLANGAKVVAKWVGAASAHAAGEEISQQMDFGTVVQKSAAAVGREIRKRIIPPADRDRVNDGVNFVRAQRGDGKCFLGDISEELVDKGFVLRYGRRIGDNEWHRFLEERMGDGRENLLLLEFLAENNEKALFGQFRAWQDDGFRQWTAIAADAFKEYAAATVGWTKPRVESACSRLNQGPLADLEAASRQWKGRRNRP